MPLTLPLALLLEPAGDHARAVALAEALSVPLIDDPHQTDLLLVLGPEGLALRRPNDPELPGVLRVDFDRPAARQRQRQPHRELVVQAARLRGTGNEPLLVDATAGLGRDGFLLATAGFNDSRVQYWEPAKWVARLRPASTSGKPILLKINMEAGHGGASGRFDYLKEVAHDYAFAVWAIDRGWETA